MKEIIIPENIKRVKIDIGLSTTSPQSNKWLIKEEDLYVMAFEPNPECCDMIENNKMPKAPFPDFNLEQRFIKDGRYQLFRYALSNVTKEEKMSFYVSKRDAGTSSLFLHDQKILGRIKKRINVPVISLKMVFDSFPWERFEYIEYIKIDAQGSDLKILKGAGDYLKERVVFVTAEPDGHYYQGAEDCTEENITKYMESINFTKINHSFTVDPTYINNKFLHLKDKIFIHQSGPWPC